MRASALVAAREHRPDVAPVASDLPGGGLEAVRAITPERPHTRIVVLTARLDRDELLAAMLSGAFGYLGKR